MLLLTKCLTLRKFYSIRYPLVGLSFTYHLGSSTSNNNEIVSLNSSIACER